MTRVRSRQKPGPAGGVAGWHAALERWASRWVPFDWKIDPYPGSNDLFCYGRTAHELAELAPPPTVGKLSSARELAERFRQNVQEVQPGEAVAIGAASDSYPADEERSCRTRAILETLREVEGLDITITTRSNLVIRDLDLLAELSGRRHRIAVHVPIATLDRRLSRALELEAARPDLRLKAVSELAAASVPVGVVAAPVLPGITDDPQALDHLAGAASGAGAGWLLANPLFVMPSAIARFFPSLEEAYPDLVQNYREGYEQRAVLPEAYARGLAILVARLCRTHELDRGRPAAAGSPGRRTKRVGRDQAIGGERLRNGQLPLL